MRMRRFSWLLATSMIVAVPAASADTLRQALARAYETNPTLAGERQNLRATDAAVPIARASGLPQVTTSGGYVENVLSNSGNSLGSPRRQATASVDLTVPLYSGGSVINSVRAAERRVEAGRASLRSVEADVFTAVVAAYMDVIRDEAIVGLNQQNVKVLEVNLQATRDRFEVGDLTRTDVAQSEARLALAQADLRSSESSLIGSRENYIRIIGTPPGELAPPPPLPNLPPDTETAVRIALDRNPVLESVRKQGDASRYDVDVARAARLPRLNGVAGGDYFNYLGSLGSGTSAGLRQDGTAATVGLSLSIPLYQGGRPVAQVRQAQARSGVALELVIEAERSVVSQTRSTFAEWQSARRVIEASQVAVKANELSLEGVRAENSVGTRTILEILNAQQELLSSKVQLVIAQRDEYVAGFALLAATGQAEARDLGLDGGPLYDPTTNYKAVRGNLFDWAPAPDPVITGTRTVDTPPQTSVVKGPPEP